MDRRRRWRTVWRLALGLVVAGLVVVYVVYMLLGMPGMDHAGRVAPNAQVPAGVVDEAVVVVLVLVDGGM